MTHKVDLFTDIQVRGHVTIRIHRFDSGPRTSPLGVGWLSFEELLVQSCSVCWCRGF